ncbi:MAG: DUF3039 domain-containing protein [Marmoricola sp.]
MSEQSSNEPRVGFSTDVLEDARVVEELQHLEDGDHERFSHYVPKDKLMEAMVNGTPVVALCGKVWVPSRDPQKFPVCPDCKEIWESMQDGDGPDA